MSVDSNYLVRAIAPCRAADLGLLPQGSSRYLSWKPFLDVTLGILVLILSAPLMLLVMTLVKLTSRGPVIYAQERVGRGGRRFTIYKIRTMIRDSEHKTGPVWAAARDPRVTMIGRFLRWSHLDEMPQLWNIIRGEMSLVGPRPERPEFVAELERAIPHYRCRLSVPPGLTGLAQIQLPPDSDFAGVRRKLAFDLYYVQRLDPGLDLRLLLCTALFLFGIPFAVSRRLLRVPNAEVAEDAYRDLIEAEPVPQMQPA